MDTTATHSGLLVAIIGVEGHNSTSTFFFGMLMKGLILLNVAFILVIIRPVLTIGLEGLNFNVTSIDCHVDAKDTVVV